MPVPKLLRNLGYFAAAAYLVVGIVGGLLLPHWVDASASDQASVDDPHGRRGDSARRRPPPLPALALGRRGARLGRRFLGALPVFWTGVGLVLAVVIVLLAVRHARGPSRAARRAEPLG